MKIFKISTLSPLLMILMLPLAHANDDVTVLQAWYGGDDLTPMAGNIGHGGDANKAIDPSLCSSTVGQYGLQDCTAAVEAAEGEPAASAFPMSPKMTDYCQTIEIRTVSPLSVVNSPVFAGIGFSFNESSCEYDVNPAQSGVFIPKEKLKQVGTTVLLKDGTPANVYAFIAQGECLGEGADGYNFMFGMQKFKPYAKYTLGNPDTRWDSANDYKLGCIVPGYEANSSSVQNFDRQKDLLKQ